MPTFDSQVMLADVRFGSLADLLGKFSLMSVYGLPLVCKQAGLADMARLHTYIRPLKLAYVDAGP